MWIENYVPLVKPWQQGTVFLLIWNQTISASYWLYIGKVLSLSLNIAIDGESNPIFTMCTIYSNLKHLR